MQQIDDIIKYLMQTSVWSNKKLLQKCWSHNA